MPRTAPPPVLAAIDVGTNAVRLELARAEGDGSLETIHQERDPIRPGEGVFSTGSIPDEVADRLVLTLRRYALLCRRYKAQVRAVATAALRDAANREEIVRRARTEAGLELEVVSGLEEARLICLGVLHRKPKDARSLLIDIGGGSTEVISAQGETPLELWSLPLGAVRLTELFGTGGAVNPAKARLLRGHCAEVLRRHLPKRPARAPKVALGSSGTINALIGYVAEEGTGHATLRQLTRAVDALALMPAAQRRKHFDPRRAEIIVAGAVILEQVAKHLGCESVSGVNRGLRDGILVDLLHRLDADWKNPSLTEAALALGRKFHFDEAHCTHVAGLALELFDDLEPLHELPSSARAFLEVAALLHDVGNAVSHDRHHKHTYYLIHHADIAGLSDGERELVALVARYHRRSPPDPSHAGMAGLGAVEARAVRRLATILRLANALDRSHMQTVRRVKARRGREAVTLLLRARGPVDLEQWSVEREAENFRRVFGKRLECAVEG